MQSISLTNEDLAVISEALGYALFRIEQSTNHPTLAHKREQLERVRKVKDKIHDARKAGK